MRVVLIPPFDEFDNGRVISGIYVTDGCTEFPGADWVDFPLPVLHWWLFELLKPRTIAQLDFMSAHRKMLVHPSGSVDCVDKEVICATMRMDIHEFIGSIADALTEINQRTPEFVGLPDEMIDFARRWLHNHRAQ